jgi:DnaK suppressor protein
MQWLLPMAGHEELTEEQTKELHSDLLTLREEIATLLEASQASTRAIEPDAAIGRLTRIDAMQQQSMAIEERRRRQIRQQQITGALAAVELGEYGFCRRCEEPVGYRRLKARPESPFCVPCMSAFERR